MFNRIKKHKKDAIIIVILSLTSYILVSIPPIFMGRLIDDSLLKMSMNYKFLVIVFIAAFLSLVLSRWLSVLLSNFSAHLIKDEYMNSVRILLKKERKLFREVKIGEIIDLFSKYISSFESALIGLIGDLIPSLIAIVTVMLAIVYTTNIYVLGTVMLVQGIFLLISHQLMKIFSRDLIEHTKADYALSDEWIELLGNNKIVQSEMSFEHSLSRLEEAVSKRIDCYIKKNKSNELIANTLSFGQTISLMSTIGVLTYFLVEGSITIGETLTVIALSGLLHSHLKISSLFFVDLKSYKAFANDFTSLSNYKTYIEGVQHFTKIKSIDTLKIQAKDIVRNEKKIFSLKNSFSIQKNEKLLILGLSGAGKSTFLSFFFNSYKEHDLDVTINNRPVREISSKNYQELVRNCFQENEIFSGRSYHSWFQKPVSHDAANKLLTQLRLPPDICSGERHLEAWSGNISGGEAKRMNLARLLMTPGHLNIIDEPTTGLNVSLTHHIWDIIFEKLSDKMLICASHDLSALNRFTRVLIIDDGHIVADTIPSEIEKNIYFKKIKDKL